MAKEKFDPLNYYLIKCYMHAQILREKTQCEECEHMNFWLFSPDYYEKIVSKKYCPQCSKYDGKPYVFKIESIPSSKGGDINGY